MPLTMLTPPPVHSMIIFYLGDSDTPIIATHTQFIINFHTAVRVSPLKHEFDFINLYPKNYNGFFIFLKVKTKG